MIDASLFGERLKSERKRLGLNQAEIADLVGVSREYWGKCERGDSVPGGEVLAGVEMAGADVRYVLTGSRGAQAQPDFNPEEQTLVQYYRAAPKDVQRMVMGALLGVSQLGAMQSNSGAGAVQVGTAKRKIVVKNGS